MKQIFLFFVLFLPFCDSSQVESVLSDSSTGIISEWKGDMSLFEINNAGQIRLNAPAEAGEASVYTLYPTSKDMQWTFDVALGFNPSNTNNARIYLFTAEEDQGYNAYYLQVGSNNDDVSLKNTLNSTSLIRGKKGRLNMDKVTLRVKLILENKTTWTLYTRLAGESAYHKEGSYSRKIESIPSEGHFKINCRYSKTRSKLFSFEAIGITDVVSHESVLPDDEDTLSIKDIRCLSPEELCLLFTKEMDFSRAVFVLSGVGAGRLTVSSDKKQVVIHFDEAMQNGLDYTLSWEGVFAADGQAFPDDFIDFTFEATDGEDPDDPGDTPSGDLPQPGDIVFNEILYDPQPGGSEYIELYNRSSADADISALLIAVRKQNGELSTGYSLSTADCSTLEAGEYLAFSKSIQGVTSFYSVPDDANLCEVKLPVLPNTGTTLVLADAKTGEVIDELSYTPDWHAPLLKNTKGVSLERIDPDEETQNPDNWGSASAASGFGTPGYCNSLSLGNTLPEDGQEKEYLGPPVREADDLYSVVYQLLKPGYGCKAVIFDAVGRTKIRLPVDNALLKSGKITWRMLTSGGKKLPVGMYIFYVEFFHPSGDTKQYKRAFVLQ